MAETTPPSEDRPTGCVVATVQIPTSSECVDDVIATLRSVVGPSLANRTCSECRVLRDASDELFVLYYERWESFSAFERHVRSDLYRRVLVAIDMASEPPDVRFECLNTTWGLDLVGRLRKATEERNTK
jgi:quinol monooxygenase YgiN